MESFLPYSFILSIWHATFQVEWLQKGFYTLMCMPFLFRFALSVVLDVIPVELMTTNRHWKIGKLACCTTAFPLVWIALVARASSSFPPTPISSLSVPPDALAALRKALFQNHHILTQSLPQHPPRFIHLSQPLKLLEVTDRALDSGSLVRCGRPCNTLWVSSWMSTEIGFMPPWVAVFILPC